MTKPAWLLEAEKHDGYRERPNNDTIFGTHYGLNHEPWCDMFVAYCCEKSGHPLPAMQPGMPTGAAAVAYSMGYAKSHGLWIPSWDAKPGDQIVYGWNGPTSTPENMHTGFIETSGPQGSTGTTIEGNRGDQVGRHTFVVGESVVLGCVDLNRLLGGRPKVVVKPKPGVKPEPQPRNPVHPAHTGPLTRPQRRNIRRTIASLRQLLRGNQ